MWVCFYCCCLKKIKDLNISAAYLSVLIKENHRKELDLNCWSLVVTDLQAEKREICTNNGK